MNAIAPMNLKWSENDRMINDNDTMYDMVRRRDFNHWDVDRANTIRRREYCCRRFRRDNKKYHSFGKTGAYGADDDDADDTL